ncbi:MAG: hypothetical protein ACKOXB_11585 [Flavobacteriales bacterium]
MTKKLLVILLLFPLCTYAHTWIDPYFDEAVENAALICVGEVEKSTDAVNSIKLIEVFKGDQMSGDVVKIVSPAHSHDHKGAQLNKGDRFFFMVKKGRKEYEPFSETFWRFAMNDTVVRVSVRDPLLRINMERRSFETFLKLLIKNASREEGAAFAEEQVKKLLTTDPLTKTMTDVEIQMFSLEVLYHFGQAQHAAKAKQYLASPYYHIRWSCVRALSGCKGADAEKAIIEHLENEEELTVQSVLGKAVYDMDLKAAKGILEKQIPDLSNEDVHLAANIMNPVFNELPSPRDSWGAALMKINAVEGTYDELVAKAQEYLLTYSGIRWNILENKTTYYSLEEALLHADSALILNLSNKELTELPADIQQLKNLKALDISGNKLKSLPAYIAKLGLLELNLAQNEFTAIPEVLYQCTTLTNINFTSNRIERLDLRFFALIQLEELSFRMNKLDSLPAEISKLIHLKKVELYGNRFVDFPLELIACPELKTVLIGSNSIKHLPAKVTEMKKLKYIDLSYNPLSLKERNEIAKFPARIGVNTETYDRFFSIYEAMENADAATIIHDSYNDYSKFSGDMSVLKNATSIVLTDDKLEIFPAGLTQLNNLQTLVLYDNNLKEIPKEIGNMKALTLLNLHNNQLTTLPKEIALLPLTNLNLSKNNFSDAEKTKIESWFEGKSCSIIW